MTVHFIGAGPGAADLITLRGLMLIRACPVVLYAGSLVPRDLIDQAADDAPAKVAVVDTAPLTLDQILEHLETAHRAGHDVARVHSGDPSLYGAIAEQMRRLDALGIPYAICPGVPAFAAAAAVLERELTLPGLAQTVILTRVSARSSPMPEGERLETLAQSGATLVLHLSVRSLGDIARRLAPYYGADCPAAVVYRATWPDEQVIAGTLASLPERVAQAGITRTALILVGRCLDPATAAAAARDSRLYAADHAHVLRPTSPTTDG